MLLQNFLFPLQKEIWHFCGLPYYYFFRLLVNTVCVKKEQEQRVRANPLLFCFYPIQDIFSYHHELREFK